METLPSALTHMILLRENTNLSITFVTLMRQYVTEYFFHFVPVSTAASC